MIEQFLDQDYNPMFHTEVRIEGLSAGTGTGYSKKESQQNAAQMALKKIKSDEAFKEAIETAKIQNHAAKEIWQQRKPKLSQKRLCCRDIRSS